LKTIKTKCFATEHLSLIPYVVVLLENDNIQNNRIKKELH